MGLTLWITAQIVMALMHTPSGNPTVVVLGCRVYDDRPSLALIERLDATKAYLEANPAAVAILSGGQGKGETVTEASAMYKYLIQEGIAEERLILEEKSTSTRENLRFSQAIIQEKGLQPEMAIITNEFHQYRAGKIASDLGIAHSAVSAHTAWWLFPTFYVRELYGAMYEYVF